MQDVALCFVLAMMAAVLFVFAACDHLSLKRQFKIAAVPFTALLLAVLFYVTGTLPFGRDTIFEGDFGDTIELPNGVVVDVGKWYSKSDLLDEGQDFIRIPCPEIDFGDYLVISGFPKDAHATYIDSSGKSDDVMVLVRTGRHEGRDRLAVAGKWACW